MQDNSLFRRYVVITHETESCAGYYSHTASDNLIRDMHTKGPVVTSCSNISPEQISKPSSFILYNFSRV